MTFVHYVILDDVRRHTVALPLLAPQVQPFASRPELRERRLLPGIHRPDRDRRPFAPRCRVDLRDRQLADARVVVEHDLGQRVERRPRKLVDVGFPRGNGGALGLSLPACLPLPLCPPGRAC